MATEFRSFIAEAITSLNFGSTAAVMMSTSMNCPTTRRSRWCTRSSAAMSSGSATRKRACISMSYRNGSPTPPSFAIDQGEKQERQPGEQADEDDPPLQEFESRGGEPRTHPDSWNRGPPRTSEKSGGSLELCMLFMIPSRRLFSFREFAAWSEKDRFYRGCLKVLRDHGIDLR